MKIGDAGLGLGQEPFPELDFPGREPHGKPCHL